MRLPKRHAWQSKLGAFSSDPKRTFRSAGGSRHSRLSRQGCGVGIDSGKGLEWEGSSLKRQDRICVVPGMQCSHGAAEPRTPQTHLMSSFCKRPGLGEPKDTGDVCATENRALATESHRAPGACRDYRGVGMALRAHGIPQSANPF